jgi:hypothetical protein
VDVGDVTVETFAGREGETFAMLFDDGTLELELISVDQAPEEWGRSERRAPFSVIFHGTPEHVLPQQIWKLEHPELGALDVFVVPIGPDAESGRMRYQAVFT